jgi:hypothetical protein
MVEAGESEYFRLLKTRNLLIFRNAQNARNGKFASNWNVSGTRFFGERWDLRELDFAAASLGARDALHIQVVTPNRDRRGNRARR